MNGIPYDKTSSKSIEQYTKKLIGKTFREAIPGKELNNFNYMKFPILIILLITILSNITFATNYIDEFSLDGKSCFLVDEFNYKTEKTTERVTIYGCCDINSCFYFPMNELKNSTFTNEFQKLLQYESARQNIYKNKLSDSVFIFEQFFDFCDFIEMEPVENQVIGGIVDITDKTLPYAISANKAKDFSNGIKVLKGAKIISSFDIRTFTLSSACSIGNKKETKILEILSNGGNAFINIKSGNIGHNDLSNYKNFIYNLNIETKRKDGFWGDLTEITYTISSLLTGGNIVEFSRNRIGTFKLYENNLTQEVINISNSIEKFNSYIYDFKKREDHLSNSIDGLKSNIGFWEKIISRFGFESEVTSKIKDLKNGLKIVNKLNNRYLHKSADKELENLFKEVNQTYTLQTNNNYTIKNEIFCDYDLTPYQIINETYETQSIPINKTFLKNNESKVPFVEWRGGNANNCINQNCSIELQLRNQGDKANINFSANLILYNFTSKLNNNINISLKNIEIDNGLNKILYLTILEDEFIYVKVEDIKNISITYNSNEFYYYIEETVYKPIKVNKNETITKYTPRIFCDIKN